MTDAIAHVNWIAILAAAVAYFVLGGVWFGAIVGHYQVVLGIADRETQSYSLCRFTILCRKVEPTAPGTKRTHHRPSWVRETWTTARSTVWLPTLIDA